MENFKIRSIDEFDFDFVAKINEQKNNEISSVSDEIVITEPVTDEPVNENQEDVNISFFSKSAEPEIESEPETHDDPASPVALSYESVSEGTVNQPEKSKRSGAATAGKIASIIMLAATIIVFVLGCFVTIFLDNNGSNLFGLCFNTISADIYDSTGSKIISKGDLIISEKADVSEYVSGKMIVVKSNNPESDYSDLHIINGVMSVTGTNAHLTTTNLADPYAGSLTVMSEDTYGIESSYIPLLGTILHFAMDNAILVCVLFVLLAALWCLILVLIENQKTKPQKDNQ